MEELIKLQKEGKLSDNESHFFTLFQKMAVSTDQNMVALAKKGISDLTLAKATSWKVVKLNEKMQETDRLDVSQEIKDLIKDQLKIEMQESMRHSFRPQKNTAGPSSATSTKPAAPKAKPKAKGKGKAVGGK